VLYAFITPQRRWGFIRRRNFVAPLPFNLGLVQLLADHRNVFLTNLSLAAAFVGSSPGYILLILLFYVAWNKRVAFRLTVVLLAASSLGNLLKMLLRNPRPFVAQGTYLKKWAVSPSSARSLATEYSTPSGHAIGASSFYAYLYGVVRSRTARVLAVTAILLIGVSRPYLGVHYCEDVLLGWALGLAVALLSLRYSDAVAVAWSRLSYTLQVVLVASTCLALWLLAILLNGDSATGQPHTSLDFGGFLTGIVLARPLEVRIVNFDPRSSTALVKILRYILTVGLLVFTLLILDKAFGLLADRSLLLWNLLEYLRYTAAGFVAFFLAPLLFTRIGWAEKARKGAS
jgi:membrane-associated phospholipid phosphatase